MKNLLKLALLLSMFAVGAAYSMSKAEDLNGAIVRLQTLAKELQQHEIVFTPNINNAVEEIKAAQKESNLDKQFSMLQRANMQLHLIRNTIRDKINPDQGVKIIKDINAISGILIRTAQTELKK